jgi:hypothetical protein
MRKAILGAASALALASPAVANGVTPYSGDPSYGGEAPTYEYRTPAPVVVEESAPVVVVRRPVVVAPLPVVVDEYPAYAAPRVYAVPRVYAAPPVYAYAGSGWRGGWNNRRHFRGGW